MLSELANSLLTAVSKMFETAEAITQVTLVLLTFIMRAAGVMWNIILGLVLVGNFVVGLLMQLILNFYSLLSNIFSSLLLLPFFLMKIIANYWTEALRLLPPMMPVLSYAMESCENTAGFFGGCLRYIGEQIHTFICLPCCYCATSVFQVMMSFINRGHSFMMWLLQAQSTELALLGITCLCLFLLVRICFGSFATSKSDRQTHLPCNTNYENNLTLARHRSQSNYGISDDEDEDFPILHNYSPPSDVSTFDTRSERSTISAFSVNTLANSNRSSYADHISISDTESSLGTISEFSTESDSFDDEDSDRENDQNAINVQLPDRQLLKPPSDLGEAKSNVTDKLCVICQHSQKNVLLLPCRHMCLCVDCAYTMLSLRKTNGTKCPLCRTPVNTVMNVYF